MLAAASTWGRTLAGPQTLQRPQAALQTRRARRQGRQAPGRRVSHLVAAAAQPTSSSGAGEEDTGRDFASSLALMVMGASLISERINGCGIVQQLELGHPHIEPVLIGIAGILAVAAVWPSKHKAANAAELVRQLAGRAAFGGLAAAVAAEVWAGKGLLALLEVGTGEALSEVEAVLAVLLMFVLTGPRKPSSAR